jgi:hypothetical protein
MATPNFYVLSGPGLHVSYSTTSFAGVPQFHYQDGFQSHSFSGPQIKTEETALGTLVTVVTRMTVDTGSTTFTLVVPPVTLPASNTAPINTLGITTVHKFSVVKAFMVGQDDLYTVTYLHGTAEHVVF